MIENYQIRPDQIRRTPSLREEYLEKRLQVNQGTGSSLVDAGHLLTVEVFKTAALVAVEKFGGVVYRKHPENLREL